MDRKLFNWLGRKSVYPIQVRIEQVFMFRCAPKYVISKVVLGAAIKEHCAFNVGLWLLYIPLQNVHI